MRLEIKKSGTRLWLNLIGQLHRTDGPAFENNNGNKEWWINGEKHREDGPACEYNNGIKWWFLKDKRFSKKQFDCRLF